MTKTQKIWLLVFLAMFIVPEVLWSPVGNSLYSRIKPLENGSVQFLRENFFTNVDNINILGFVLAVQFFGQLLSLIYLVVLRKQFQNKVMFWFFVLTLFLLTLLTFFDFGLSISLRNIGL